MGKYNHPQITMQSIPLATYMQSIRRKDWKGVADLLLDSAAIVNNAGADFVICPSNSCHLAFEQVQSKSPIPWLHIADVVAAEAEQQKFRQVGILGTKCLMESQLYPAVMKRRRIHCSIPNSLERVEIDRIISHQLRIGLYLQESATYLCEVVGRLRRNGCDAVVLGNVELPLLVWPDESPLPILDSTRLLATAALRKAFPSGA